MAEEKEALQEEVKEAPETEQVEEEEVVAFTPETYNQIKQLLSKMPYEKVSKTMRLFNLGTPLKLKIKKPLKNPES